jgi:hypothetical protein
MTFQPRLPPPRMTWSLSITRRQEAAYAGPVPTWSSGWGWPPLLPRHADARFRLGFTRQVTHCWRHNSWLRSGRDRPKCSSTSGIPEWLIHERLDISVPSTLHGAFTRRGQAASSSSLMTKVTAGRPWRCTGAAFSLTLYSPRRHRSWRAGSASGAPRRPVDWQQTIASTGVAWPASRAAQNGSRASCGKGRWPRDRRRAESAISPWTGRTEPRNRTTDGRSAVPAPNGTSAGVRLCAI